MRAMLALPTHLSLGPLVKSHRHHTGDAGQSGNHSPVRRQATVKYPSLRAGDRLKDLAPGAIPGAARPAERIRAPKAARSASERAAVDRTDTLCIIGASISIHGRAWQTRSRLALGVDAAVGELPRRQREVEGAIHGRPTSRRTQRSCHVVPGITTDWWGSEAVGARPTHVPVRKKHTKKKKKRKTSYTKKSPQTAPRPFLLAA